MSTPRPRAGGALAVGALACILPLIAHAQLPSRTDVLSVVSKVNNYWIQNHPSAGSLTNNWNGAAYVIGDLAAYDATGDSNYLNYALSWASSHSYGLYGGDATRDPDDHAAGQVYIRLYQLLGDSSRLTHLTTSVQAMVSGTKSSDWTWADALHMAMPTFAELGEIRNDPAYANRMYDFYNYTKRTVGGPGLYNPTDRLWVRDASFLGSKVYWARGNAWVFVAHARVLETLPTTDPHYTEYLGAFRDLAAKLLTLQQSDGFWRADLTNPARYPTPETSGTAGFTYGMAWGINAGALDAATYLPAVTKAWNGMVATAVRSDGLLGYVQGVGKGPGDSQPVTSSNTADFGVGLFLMAGAEVARLAPATAQVSAPTFSPGGGTYSTAQTVTISTTAGGASIRYTLNGSTPSNTAGTLYSGPVSISATATLKAIAYKSGSTDSSVTSASYAISAPTQVAAPSFSPGGGSFTSAQSVTITTSTSGASIRYTTNGSTPSSASGTVYSSPVAIGATTTLKAIAYKSGLTDSSVASATYTISAATQVAAPSFSPSGGSFTSAQSVTITTSTSGASIRYTTNGSTPSSTSGTTYSSPVAIGATTTLKAIAYKSGLMDSSVNSASFTIGVANRTLTGTSSNGWHALALSTAQTGTFTATYDATPSVSSDNAVVGLSKGAATAYGNLSCIARFNPVGQIDAYNGTGYAAASTIPYSASVSYHFRLVVNVTAHTYSIYVTPAGGSELTVGLNYAFRSTANTVTSLDTWNLEVDPTVTASLTATNLTP